MPCRKSSNIKSKLKSIPNNILNMKKSLTILLIIINAFAISSCQTGSEKKDQSKDKDTVQTTLQVPQKISFPSKDKLPISANLYFNADNNKGFIVLCHMAGFNKSEYRQIAKDLLKKGYNSLAIDQRSGGTTSGYDNETFDEAIKRELPTGFLDAEQDIIAAVNYAYNTYGEPVILWGSSYSASLALKVGKSNEHVKAIVAFSPGEYFEKDSLILKNYIRDINKPVFITSSRDEVNNELIAMIDVIGPKNVTHFRPKGKGEHGSIVLWEDEPDNLEYWNAVEKFLNGLK
jgi:dienelactone hydrolase